MVKQKNKKYYDILKEYFIDRRVYENTCELYDRYMTHKYRHSMKVIKAGREIIENDINLKNLPEDIQDDFVNACLFHDLARSFDVNPADGKFLFRYHGIEGAKIMQKLGIDNLNILIPVMLHDLINGVFLYLPMYELEIDDRYMEQSDENKEFIKNMRKKFWELSDVEQRIIELGRRVVKDADMLANFLEFERMSAFGRYTDEQRVSEQVKSDFYKPHLVNINDIETLAEYICLLAAWGSAIYFPHTIKMIQNNNIMQKISAYYVELSEKSGISHEEMAPVLEIINEGIKIVENKMQDNIKNHIEN